MTNPCYAATPLKEKWVITHNKVNTLGLLPVNLMYLRTTEEDKAKECSNVYYQCLSRSLSILQIKKIIL